MKKLIAALIIGLALASASAFAIAGSYDPYAVTPGNEVYRASAFASSITGGAILGPRYYGRAYDNYLVVDSSGRLGTYRKVVSKVYDPEQRAYRGTRARTKVLRDRIEVSRIPTYVNGERVR